jgi:hypothetical protein
LGCHAARPSTPWPGSAALPVYVRGDTVMRRQQLTEAQMAALFDPPIDRRDLVRYYTLSEADTAMIRRCRGDHSRLGYALMLCYLRYPGRPLRINERPPAAPISFVAGHRDTAEQRGPARNRCAQPTASPPAPSPRPSVSATRTLTAARLRAQGDDRDRAAAATSRRYRDADD